MIIALRCFAMDTTYDLPLSHKGKENHKQSVVGAFLDKQKLIGQIVSSSSQI